MEGYTRQRLDGIYRFVSDPRIHKKVRRLSALSLAFAVVFGLATSAALPTLTKGEVGAASGNRLWSSGAELNSLTANMEITGSSGATPSVSSTTKRSGDYAFRANTSSNTALIYKTWAESAQSNKFWFRTYIYVATTPGAETKILTVGGGANNKIGVRMNSDRSIELWNEEDNTQIGSASSTLSASTWYRVEIFVDTTTLASTDAELRLDGVSVASSTAENLAAAIDRYTWGVGTSTTADLFFDDIAINDSNNRSDNWPGEGKIVHLRPSAAGDNAQWGREGTDSGANWSQNDEVTPNDGTDYTRDTTSGNIDDYNIVNATDAGIAASDFIKLVSVNSRYSRCGAGSIGGPGDGFLFVERARAQTPAPCPIGAADHSHYLRVKASASGTVEESAAISDSVDDTWKTNALTTAHLSPLTLYDLPGSSTASWTASDLDSAQVGIRNNANSPTFQTAIWLLVEYVPVSGGRIFSSGFELNSTTSDVEWTTMNAQASIVSSPARSGSYALRLNSTSDVAFATHAFSSTNINGDFYMRAYVRIPSAPSDNVNVVVLRNSSGSILAYLRITVGGAVRLADEDANNIGSDSSALEANRWYRLELRLDTTGSGGSHVVEGKVDGVTFATASDRDISSGAAQASLGWTGNSTADVYIDDVALNQAIGTTQNSWPGSGKIIHLKPNAAGDSSDWTKNGAGCTGGANYECVDEVTPDDSTTYVSTGTANAVDDYNVEDITLSSQDTISLVSVGARLSSSSGTQEDIRVRLKDSSGGVPIESPLISPASTTWTTHKTASPYNYALAAYTRPESGVAWTDSVVDSAQIGVRDYSGSGTAQVSTMWLLVEYVKASVTITGTVYSDEGSTAYDCSADNLTVGISVNGGTAATGTCTVSGGTYTIETEGKPTAAGEPIVVWIDSGETPKATTVTLSADADSDISGLDLYQNRLITRHESSGPIANSNLATGDNGNAGIRYSVSSGNLTVESGISLHVWTGDNFTPGGTVTTNTTGGDVKVASSATLSMGSNALSIGGSYTNSGTFTAGTSTTTFTSTATGKTLSGTMTGGSAFYNLTFNGSGGGWTFSNNVQNTNDFNLTLGTITTSSNDHTNGRDFIIANTASATYTAGGSTVTVGRNFSDPGNRFTEGGSSTVVMSGTGNLDTGPGNLAALSVAYTGNTTTFVSGITISNVLTFNGGTATADANRTIIPVCSSSCTPVVFASPTTLNNSGGSNATLAMQGTTTSGLTVTIPAADYGSWPLQLRAGSNINATISLAGNITSTNSVIVRSAGAGAGVITLETNNHTVSVGSLLSGNATGTNSTELNFGSSTVSLTTAGAASGVVNNGGSHTWNLGSANISLAGDMRFVQGTGSISVSAGTSTLNFNRASSTQSLIPNTGGSTLYNLTHSGNSAMTVDTNALTVNNDLTNTGGAITGTVDITVKGNVTGTGSMTWSSPSTFEQRIDTNKNFGTSSGTATWTFNNLTFSNSHASAGRTITTDTGGTGGITVSGVLSVGKSGDAAGATTTLSAGNRTWTLSGTGGDPFQILASPAGVLTPATSTFTYTGNNGAGVTVVEAATYYNLTINNASETYNLSGATTTNNNLTITAGTLDAVSGQDYALSVGGNWTNSGTFTAQAGLVTMTATTTGKTITSGGSAFWDLTLDGASGEWTIQDALFVTDALTADDGTLTGTQNVTVNASITGNNGTINMTGGTFEQRVSLDRDFGSSTGTQVWTFNNLVFSNSHASTTRTISTQVTATGGINITGSLSIGKSGDTAATVLDAGNRTWTLSGTGGSPFQVLSSPAGSLTGNTSTFAYTGNNGSGNTTVAAVSYNNLTLNNASETFVLSGSTTAGGDLTITAGTLDAVSGQNYALSVGGSWANSGTFIAQNGTVTLTSTSTGKNLTSGGSAFYNLTFNGSGGSWILQDALSVGNNITITAGTLDTKNGSNFGITVGGNWNNSGTFTARASTVTFTATSSGKTITTGGSNFYAVTFNGSGGEWTLQDTTTLVNSLVMTEGTLLGTQDLFIFGAILGTNGVINLTGGTTEMRDNGNRNFGASSGSVAWTFYNLTFASNGSGRTVNTNTGGTGNINVTNELRIGKAADPGATTLNAGNRTWNLSGTTGTPFTILTSPAATFTASTSTFVFSGNNGSGNTTVPGTTYYNLTIDNASETYDLAGDTTVSNNLGLTNGLLDTTSANSYALNVTNDVTMNNSSSIVGNASTITVGGNWTSNATWESNIGTSTVVLSGTGKTVAVATNSAAVRHFYNLTISGSISTTGSGRVNTDNDTTVSGTFTVDNGAGYSSGFHHFGGSGTTFHLTSTGTLASNNGSYFNMRSGGQTVTLEGTISAPFVYNYSSSQAIPAYTYGSDLRFSLSANNATYTLGSGTFTIGGNWIMDALNNASRTLTTTNSTNNSTVTVSGNVEFPADNGAMILTMGSAAYSVGGSWINTDGSTVNSDTSTVTFTSTATGKTITSAAQSFYNLTFNGSGGSWILEDALDANNNLTITAGTLDVKSGSNFAVTIGGSYSNSGTFTARNGTVTFDSTATGKTLGGTMTGGSSFYNLVFNGAGGEWTLGAAVTATNDFTISNGAVVANDNDLSVTRDFVLENVSGVSYDAGSSTLTISRHFTDTGNKFVRGTSDIVLNGTGTMTAGTNLPVTNLSIGYSGNTTTLVTQGMYIFGTLTFNGGTVTSSTFVYSRCTATCAAPVVFASPTTLNGNGSLVLNPITAGITATLPGGDYGNWRLNNTHGANNTTIQVGGTITTTREFIVRASGVATGSVFNTQDNDINASQLWFGDSNASASTTSNFGSSAVTLTGGGENGYSGDNGNHTLNLQTATFNIAGSLALANGASGITLDPGTSSVTFSSSSAGKTIRSNNQSFYDLIFDGTGGSWTLQDALDVNNDLTITNGTLDVDVTGNFAVTIGGSYSNSGTFTARNGTVTFDSTATGKTLGGTMTGGSSFYNLVFNGAGGEWTLGAAVTATNDLNLAAGTLDTNSSGNYAVNANRDLVIATAGATFTARASTVTVGRDYYDEGNNYSQGTSTLVMNGDGSFYGTGTSSVYNLSIGYSGKTTNLDNAASLDINGVITFNGGTVSGNKNVYNKCSVTCTPVVFAAPTTLTGGGGMIFQATSGSITITVPGGDYGDWGIQIFAGGNSADVTFQLGGNFTTTGHFIQRANNTSTGMEFSTQNHSLTALSYRFGTSNSTVGTTANLGSSTVTLSGGAGIGVVDTDLGSHTINAGSSHIVSAGYVRFLNGTSTITFNAGTSEVEMTTNAVRDLVSNGQSFHDLTINSTSTVVLQDALDVDNDLNLSAGTLDTNSTSNYSVNVAGDLNSTGGTLESNSSELVLDGSSPQTVSANLTGGSELYDLTITNDSGSSASDCELTGFSASVAFTDDVTVANNYTITTGDVRVQYETGATYTFNNINWNGQSSGSRIFFRNSVASGSWNLNVTGTQTAVSYVNVSRSDATSGDIIGAQDGTNVDCGNNLNWNFSAPDVPTSLAQTKTDDTNLSVGAWTNETSVKFTATVTDSDSGDSIQLCVDRELTSADFTGIEDQCSVGVSSGSTATVTISSIGNNTQHHWRARTKDAAGSYSSWVSFGGNSDGSPPGTPADRDFGVDTTACTYAGTIFDGSTEDVDADYNDSSLTALSANWDQFACNVSGINKYEYSIGTTPGGADIKNWTDNSTSLDVTSSSLNLHTNEKYYVNVRATDNANNVSSVYSSNGQEVLPSLSFTLGSNSITFSNLNDSNNRSDTKTVSITTSTNAYGGYVVTQYAAGLLSSGSSTIPMFSSGTYASPAAWGSGFCSGASCGYGYTSSDTTIQGANKFNGGTLFAPFSTTAAGDIVADHTANVTGNTGAVVNEQYTITHKVAVDALQPAQTYQTTVYYVVTGTF